MPGKNTIIIVKNKRTTLYLSNGLEVYDCATSQYLKARKTKPVEKKRDKRETFDLEILE